MADTNSSKFNILINLREAVVNGLAFVIMGLAVSPYLHVPLLTASLLFFAFGALGGSVADIRYFLKSANIPTPDLNGEKDGQ